MSELFKHLIHRQQGTMPLVKPRRPSRFETKKVASFSGENHIREEEPRAGEAGEEFTVHTAEMPAPAVALSSREEPWKKRSTGLPTAGWELQEPTLPGRQNTPGADNTYPSKPEPNSAETALFKETPHQQPGGQLLRFSDEDDHHRPEADTDAVLKQTRTPGPIRLRVPNLIARSAETPSEMAARRAVARKVFSVPYSPDQLAGPANDPRQPVAKPTSNQSIVIGTSPKADPEQPEPTMPRREYPRVQTPAAPTPDVLSGKRRLALDQTFLKIEEKSGPYAGGNLLVPPGWLARLQRDWDTRTRKAKPEPTINVTIGRVEVRAEAPPAQPKPEVRKKASPVMSLDTYLNQRKGRG